MLFSKSFCKNVRVLHCIFRFGVAEELIKGSKIPVAFIDSIV